MRYLTLTDQFLTQVDRALKTLTSAFSSNRINPSKAVENSQPLTSKETQHSIGLMRVNHAGEVAAQALYYGQSVFSRDTKLQQTLMKAAEEEGDHLVWCQERLYELGGRSSFLDPFWYFGAFSIGVCAGFLGDKVSLGFLAETELQVEKHLLGHLEMLPEHDEKSKAIVNLMKEDEIHHAHTAKQEGGMDLPETVSILMKWSAKVMTKTAYWV